MKKKFIVIALAGVMALSLAGCGRSSKQNLTLDEQYDEVMRLKEELDAQDESQEKEEEAHEELLEEEIAEEEEEEILEEEEAEEILEEEEEEKE